MQSRIKHLLKHFALVLKAKLNQLKPFVRFVFHPSTLLSSPTYRIIKGLRIQTLFILLYASFSCPYLGGIDKSRILNILKPHIFFDDQMTHLEHLENIPAVHIPFGIANNSGSSK